MTASAEAQPRSGFISRATRAVLSLLLGTLLCLTPVTALIVLGWLMRRMRAISLSRAGMRADWPRWVMARDGGVCVRLFGGLAANVREGVLAALSLLLVTLPFTSIWVLSWWAGWENSFGKGYEQAFVGPVLGLVGVAVFCVLMVWVPMGLAHQAVENRAFALLEYRQVRSAVRHSGWGYVMLAATTVFFALPLFASRGLITFASKIVPGFEGMTGEEIATLQGSIALIKAAYVFVALVILRGWAARIYAAAVARALEGPDAPQWHGSVLAEGRVGGNRAWRLTHWLRILLLMVIWFGLAVQIYLGQFLNHDWHVWLTHPFFLLPWPV